MTLLKPNLSRPNVDVLISAAEIAGRVSTLAEGISAQLPSDMLIVALLRGSFVFTADLIRALHLTGVRPQIEFMTLSSYGSDTASSGNVEIIRDLTEDIAGRDVLIVDDILESGRTLTFARNLLTKRGAASIKIAVLLEKPGKRAAQVTADFVGFTIADKFVVGYGLDYANYYRELPFIGVITGDHG
jgi:hypoxanthine phosphoribosyltransferase